MTDSQKPIVSAVCTTFNCADGLEETLRYFARRCASGNLNEIIVVDGGSTDGTWEILVELAGEIGCLKVFQSRGCNISQGRNEAVAQAKGDIILCFDSGCSYCDDYVEKILAPFSGPTPSDVVGGATVSTGQTPFEKALVRLGAGSESTKMSSHRATAYRREVFDAVGGYKEHVQAGEDTHFNAEWIAQGFAFYKAPEAKVYWRVRGSLSSCCRMLKRNTRGHVALGERFGSNVIYIASGLYCALSAAVVLAFIFPWAWVALVVILTGYWTFRMFRKNRWRFFIKPWNYLRGIILITALDIGMLTGAVLGIADRFRSKLRAK